MNLTFKFGEKTQSILSTQLRYLRKHLDVWCYVINIFEQRKYIIMYIFIIDNKYTSIFAPCILQTCRTYNQWTIIVTYVHNTCSWKVCFYLNELLKLTFLNKIKTLQKFLFYKFVLNKYVPSQQKLSSSVQNTGCE